MTSVITNTKPLDQLLEPLVFDDINLTKLVLDSSQTPKEDSLSDPPFENRLKEKGSDNDTLFQSIEPHLSSTTQKPDEVTAEQLESEQTKTLPADSPAATSSTLPPGVQLPITPAATPILMNHNPQYSPSFRPTGLYRPTGSPSFRPYYPQPQLTSSPSIRYNPPPPQLTSSPSIRYNPPQPQLTSSPSIRYNPQSQLAYPTRRPTTFQPLYRPVLTYTQNQDYYPESSLSAANASGRKPKPSSLPPFTKDNLDHFRSVAENPDQPKAGLDLAKFLIEGVNQLKGDPIKVRQTKEAMLDEAQRILKKLANPGGIGKQGYPEAQYFLANCYNKGLIGLLKDDEKAFTLYLYGSKQNHPACTYRAAVCYELGSGTKKDKNFAMQFYRKAANLGDTAAMYKLSRILLKGLLGQSPNVREGISWLERAAHQADEDLPQPLHELACCYEKEGIPTIIPDLDYARELFTQAAQYGYAPAQFKLGLAYENGFLNCPIDPRRSIAWYSKAAEQGDVEAEFALSGWYLTGAEGILPQNDREAYLWARKAADRGSAKAAYAVGYYTETGTGVHPNLEEAKRWYIRSASQNYHKAIQRLNELRNNGARPQLRRQHTRDKNNTSSNTKDSDCSIM